MSPAQARRRARLFGRWQVTVFVGEEVVFDDCDVVRLQRVGTGVRLWTLWEGIGEADRVMEWWYPSVSEVRVERPE
jgi:hypothetical protein